MSLRKKPANLEELTSHARVAELTTVDPNTAQLQELRDEIRRLSGKIMAAPAMTKQSPTGSPSMSKKVSFAAEEQPVGYAMGGQNYENYQQQQQQSSPQRFRGGNFRGYQRPNFGQTRFQGQGQMRGNFGPRFGPRSFTPRMTPWRARFPSPARGSHLGLELLVVLNVGGHSIKTCCSVLQMENFVIFVNGPVISLQFVAQL